MSYGTWVSMPMKKVKEVPTTKRETTWFCDICNVEMPESERSVCDHCEKDLCGEHTKHFTRSITWQSGFSLHDGPNLTLKLCPKCRTVTMTYEEFLDLFLNKEMKLRRHR